MCIACNWEEFLDSLEEMTSNKKYAYANETLEGIADWIDNNGHITESQKATINKIKDKSQ